MPAEKRFLIRRMFATDIPAAIGLSRPQRWNQTEEDWRRFLALEPEGCFVAVSDGQVIATTTTELFDSVGWIGMVTVSPEWRGQGIGRAMMVHAIAYLHERGARSVKLDATPMGKPLYERLGFQEEYVLHRVVGIGVEFASHDVILYSHATPQLQKSMLSLDRRVYHTDRSAMLTKLIAGWPELAAVHLTNGQVDGYIVGRHGFLYEQIGPLVATNADTADALLRWGLNAAAGCRVCLDRPDVNRAACDLAESYGLEPLREFTRMHLGNEPYADAPDEIFATSGAEKG